MLKYTPPKNKEIRWYVLLIQFFFWGGAQYSPPITPESSVFQDDTGLGGKEGKTPEGAPRTSFARLKTFSFKIANNVKPHHFLWEIRVLPKTARQKSVNAFAQQCRFLASKAQDNLLGVSSDSLVSLSFLFPALRGRILVGRLPRVNWYSASRNYYILASRPKYPPGRG